MIYRHHSLIVLMILFFCLAACSSPDSTLIKSDSNRDVVNVIALMPVENKTQDVRVHKLLSARILEELRFKGYTQIATAVNDSKLLSDATVRGEGKADLILSKDIQGMQGVDAAMYCTLQESKSSTAFFYSPATVSVHCKLRSMKTGETIWDAQYQSTSRSFDVRDSKLRSTGALESALEEVVGKVMETLPYGPKLRG